VYFRVSSFALYIANRRNKKNIWHKQKTTTTIIKEWEREKGSVNLYTLKKNTVRETKKKVCLIVEQTRWLLSRKDRWFSKLELR